MSGLPLEGAKFTVTRLDGSPVGKEPYYVTGKDGYIRVPGLEAGYYYVQEIEAPEATCWIAPGIRCGWRTSRSRCCS